MPKVHFLNEAVTVEVEPGKTIKDAADSAGVNLFQGFWADPRYHCAGRGMCLGQGCRVWVTPGRPDAVNERTFWEKIRPTHRGAIRLACQVKLAGDVDVRTQPGALEFKPNPKWDPDPRPYRWHERLKVAGKGGGAADDADEA